MIHPLETYAIRGFIWYQGESNTERAWQYRLAFPALIQDWRKRWKRGDIPFYFCQVANGGDKTDGPPKENASAELRESQTLALKLPNTGQAILIDVGEAYNILETRRIPASALHRSRWLETMAERSPPVVRCLNR